MGAERKLIMPRVRRLGMWYQLALAEDTIPPSVVLSTDADAIVYDTFEVTATFSEDVTGFVLGDVTVTNGVASNFNTVSASVYTFDIDGSSNGTVAIDINAAVCTDLSGNPNTAAVQLTRTYDSNLLLWWKLEDAYGSATALDSGPGMYTGTATSMTFEAFLGPDGVSPAPDFNGSDSRVNSVDATLRTALTNASADKGTLVVWGKVDAGTWTDGTRRVLLQYYVNASNVLTIRKSTTNNTIEFLYIAGGTTTQINVGSLSSTAWQCFGLTWNRTTNELKAYIDGIQVGVTTTISGTWSGTVAAILVGNTANAWDGGGAGVKAWNRELSQPELVVEATP